MEWPALGSTILHTVSEVRPRGWRLSGTGPKAGGPHYLLRMALERTFTVNTTASGGNAMLLSSS